MTRIRKLDIEEWDPELREMARADSATPLEQVIAPCGDHFFLERLASARFR